jgi:hypothetical protein
LSIIGTPLRNGVTPITGKSCTKFLSLLSKLVHRQPWHKRPPLGEASAVTPFTALDCSADTCLAGERLSDFFWLVSNSWVNVLTSTTTNQLNFPLNADMTGIVIASQPLAMSGLRQAFLSLIVLKVIDSQEH